VNFLFSVAPRLLTNGDDRERDAGGDQAVLDRGGAGLVGEEAADGLHGLARIPKESWRGP